VLVVRQLNIRKAIANMQIGRHHSAPCVQRVIDNQTAGDGKRYSVL
jgi:hypothetical protein